MSEEFEIKYLGGDYFYSLGYKKQKRSIKKRLLIVFFFIVTLALIPLITFLYSIPKSSTKKVSFVQNPQVFENKKTVNQGSQSPQILTLKVLNNDSYWKISKRACGTGKNYLSIRDQNNAKPLYKDDTVVAICN